MRQSENVFFLLTHAYAYAHREIQEAKDAFGKKRITMTGKMGGAQDDLYVALAMLAFWGKVHRREAARLGQVNA